MSADEPPSLTPETKEAISAEQREVSKRFWLELEPLQDYKINVAFVMSMIEPRREPPIPKQQHKLFDILKRYAIELFECESRYYQWGESLGAWRETLAVKTEGLIVWNLNLLERPAAFLGPQKTLDVHASREEILQAVRRGLSEYIATLPTPIVFLPLPNPPATSAHGSIPATAAISETDTISTKDQLMALFDRASVLPRVVAKALKVTPKSIYRHLNGEAEPREDLLDAYEVFFSEKLGERVKIQRHRKVTLKSLGHQKVKPSGKAGDKTL
jgi:hypothetical protein